jgi:hypothetical protein
MRGKGKMGKQTWRKRLLCLGIFMEKGLSLEFRTEGHGKTYE